LRFALISFKNPAATIVIALSTSAVICNIPWGGKILKKEAITAQPGKQLFFSFRTTKLIKRQKARCTVKNDHQKPCDMTLDQARDHHNKNILE